MHSTDTINETDATVQRLRELRDELGLSRAEFKLFDEVLIDLDIALKTERDGRASTPAPSPVPGDETFYTLAGKHKELKLAIAGIAALDVVSKQMRREALRHAESCFTAALDHAAAASMRARGDAESAWERAANKVAEQAKKPSSIYDDRIYVIDGFTVEPTNERGFNTGRMRWRVTCKACGGLAHEATTGPDWMARKHLEECKGAAPGNATGIVALDLTDVEDKFAPRLTCNAPLGSCLVDGCHIRHLCVLERGHDGEHAEALAVQP